MLAVTVSGYVAYEPQIRSVGSSEVANFTVLSNYKKGEEETVTAVDCAVWGKRSNVVSSYINKGSFVTVVGTGHVTSYETSAGETRSKIEINVSDFTLPPKPKAEEVF